MGAPIKLSHEENNAAFSRVEFILSWEEGFGLNKTSASSDVASWEATHSYSQLCVQPCLAIRTQCRGWAQPGAAAPPWGCGAQGAEFQLKWELLLISGFLTVSAFPAENYSCRGSVPWVSLAVNSDLSFVALQVKIPSDASRRSPQQDLQHSPVGIILTTDFINSWGTLEAGNVFPELPWNPPSTGEGTKVSPHPKAHITAAQMLSGHFSTSPRLAENSYHKHRDFLIALLVWQIFVQILSNCHKVYVFI